MVLLMVDCVRKLCSVQVKNLRSQFHSKFMFLRAEDAAIACGLLQRSIFVFVQQYSLSMHWNKLSKQRAVIQGFFVVIQEFSQLQPSNSILTVKIKVKIGKQLERLEIVVLHRWVLPKRMQLESHSSYSYHHLEENQAEENFLRGAESNLNIETSPACYLENHFCRSPYT